MKLTIIDKIIFLLHLVFKIKLRCLWLPQKPLSVMWLVFVVVTAFFCIVPVKLVWAQIIYVDACAVESGDGSLHNPYKTLADAVSVAESARYIDMKSGTYRETITINTRLIITARNGSVLVGTDKYGVGWQETSIDIDSGVSSVNAMVYYPSCASRENAPIASKSEGLFSAIVYVHGNRRPWHFPCNGSPEYDHKDYLRAEGILKHLASSGIIVISFDWSSAETSRTPEIIVKAITYLCDKFDSSVDLQNVGLIGHSTGGGAVMKAAELLREDSNSQVQIKGIGLLAPGLWFGGLSILSEPVLIIHGTREHPCQVGLAPLLIYCESAKPKHLVVVEGANHFGYTDDICLDPDSARSNSECNMTRYILGLDSAVFLPYSPGNDNSSRVGGLTGPEAQALQQRTATNYLQAFFSHYLHGNANARDYLIPRNEELCGYTDDTRKCMEDIMNTSPSDCEPVRYFDDLQSLNVEVKVCSCLE